nr:7570_t:CDS:2 [Entrophospora candida]
MATRKKILMLRKRLNNNNNYDNNDDLNNVFNDNEDFSNNNKFYGICENGGDIDSSENETNDRKMVTTNMEIDEIKILRESSLHNNNQDNNNSIDSNKYNSKINSKKYDGYDRNQYWNYNEYYFSHDFGIFSDNVDVKRPALPKQNKPTTNVMPYIINKDDLAFRNNEIDSKGNLKRNKSYPLERL